MARVDQVLDIVNLNEYKNIKKNIKYKKFSFLFLDAFLIMAKQPSQKRTGSSSGLFSSLPGHNK